MHPARRGGQGGRLRVPDGAGQDGGGACGHPRVADRAAGLRPAAGHWRAPCAWAPAQPAGRLFPAALGPLCRLGAGSSLLCRFKAVPAGGPSSCAGPPWTPRCPGSQGPALGFACHPTDSWPLCPAWKAPAWGEQAWPPALGHKAAHESLTHWRGPTQPDLPPPAHGAPRRRHLGPAASPAQGQEGRALGAPHQGAARSRSRCFLLIQASPEKQPRVAILLQHAGRGWGRATRVGARNRGQKWGCS